MDAYSHNFSNQLLYKVSLLFLLVSSLLIPACSSQPENKLAVGDSAPLFSLQSIDGKSLNLEDLKGSPVLLRFFLTDCKFCRADTPVFNDFYKKYNKKGLKVLYVDSLGIEEKTVKAFAKELGILFPVAQDHGGEVTRNYRVRALPQTIVLDPEHKIQAAILGGVSTEELNRLLSPYLGSE